MTETPFAARPSPMDVLAFLPYVCGQLAAPFRVVVKLRFVEEYVSAIEKAKRSKRDKEPSQLISQERESLDKVSSGTPDEEGDNVVHVSALCSPGGRLLELQLLRTPVPTLLLKVIALCIPYQPYLNRITIRWGIMDCQAINEIAKILPQSQITELCLDDSPVPHRCYSLLLKFQTCLKRLSLDRCRLDDDDCVEIASNLLHPFPASKTLAVLSMSSNLIFNAGAAALATMLRSNRRLRHLNLSGNRVSNTGATALLSSLMRFPLTYDEVVSRRLRVLHNIKVRKEVYTKCYNDILNSLTENRSEERAGTRKKMVTRRKSSVGVSATASSLAPDEIAARAQAMADELLRKEDDPFQIDSTFSIDGCLYSPGNVNLSYLNLSYNNLGHPSIIKLLEVLRYQEEMPSKSQPGLVRLVLEGNPLPRSSYELQELQLMIDRCIILKVGKTPRKSEKVLKLAVKR